jgi:hypothetical protein
MAGLVQMVDNALNESRILVLVGQVLFAYSFEAVFEKPFASLPEGVKACQLAGATLLLVALALLMMPAPFHRLVEDTEDTRGFHEFVTKLVDLALPVFGAAMALEFFALSYHAAGPRAAAALAALVGATAGLFWVLLALAAKARRRS